MNEKLVDGLIGVMADNACKEVIISVALEVLKGGEKIPIGFYKDCRGMGYHFMREEIADRAEDLGILNV